MEAFYQYAGKNTGSGLVAMTEALYYTGEVGDVIRMGFPGSWSHTAIISKVIRNEQGETIDYLVHSNMADLKYFPVSAHSLPCQSLIKIAGWN